MYKEIDENNNLQNQKETTDDPEIMLEKIKSEINSKLERNQKLENKIALKEVELEELKLEVKALNEKSSALKKKVTEVENSSTWRMSAPIRALLDNAKNMFNNNGNKGKNFKGNNKHNIIKGKNVGKALVLEKKLWGGFSSYALPELIEIKDSVETIKAERVKASWYLMRWYYAQFRFEDALEEINFINSIEKRNKPDRKRVVAEVRILNRLNRKDEAKRLLESTISKLGLDQELALAMSMLQTNEEQRLEWINKVYEISGYAPIKKKDESRDFSLENLSAVVEKKAEEDQSVKVSVIIPAYNAAHTISIALDSLLEQTWKNLEIIVVDDCSTDNTRELIEIYANRDNRVKLIKQEKNQGAYPARNNGLNYVTGDYITVHDSDDWSHPQKIESQVRALLAEPEKVSVVSYWVRVVEDMSVVGPWFQNGFLIELNLSSLLFHKDVMAKLGRWDNVRVTGDTEFFWRIQRAFGESSIVKHAPNVPLSFSLRSETSLTSTKATHVRTIKFGLRRHYREAAQWWHKTAQGQSGLYLDPNKNERTFPAPVANFHKQPKDRNYDLIAVTDFTMQGGALISTYNYILAAIKQGKKVGIFHWRRYDLNPNKTLSPFIHQLLTDYDVDILVPGEQVNSELILVGYPTILKWKIDDVPKISSKKLIVLVNQMSSRLFDGTDIQYDPVEAKANVDSVFGMESEWLPISPIVKELMEKDGRYPQIKGDYWFPLIDTENWCKNPLNWRGNILDRPTVGRHGRDHYTKWPSEPMSIELAYGALNNWNVQFLGGAKTAIDSIGWTPENWTVIEFDDMEVKDFLMNLDFFVHYPHENYIEEFGRSIMEAMAIGIPVILPRVFEKTFGNAALYAEPNEVDSVIKQYWNNEELYLQRAERGRRFVLENCDLNKFGERIEKIGISKSFV